MSDVYEVVAKNEAGAYWVVAFTGGLGRVTRKKRKDPITPQELASFVEGGFVAHYARSEGRVQIAPVKGAWARTVPDGIKSNNLEVAKVLTQQEWDEFSVDDMKTWHDGPVTKSADSSG